MELGHSFSLVDAVAYADGSVVSKTILKKDVGNITLFSFDKGQGLTEHTSPFDAVVQIIDGVAQITISGVTVRVVAGEMIILPAHQPHSLHGEERFKMLLTMIRQKVEQ